MTDRLPLEMAHADYWNDAVRREGKWFCVRLLASATFAQLSISNWNATPTSVALPSGTEIFGDITVVKLSSAAPYVLYSMKETQLTLLESFTPVEYVRVVKSA